jgi:hypothetical protein
MVINKYGTTTNKHKTLDDQIIAFGYNYPFYKTNAEAMNTFPF